MKNKPLLALWGSMFILCAGLGFIPEPGSGAQAVLTGASVLFFIPPALLVYRGTREQIQLVRNLAVLSLVLTLVLLVLNFLSAMGSTAMGNILYYTLVIVSSPMICSGYWVLSLFLWACLLMVSLKKLKK